MIRPGALILDANCIPKMESSAIQEKVNASIRSANLELWPTALNFVELAKTRNAEVRRRLLKTLSSLAGRTSLLPHPVSLLSAVTNDILQGGSGFIAEASGLEGLMLNPDRLDEGTVQRAQELASQSDRKLLEEHSRGRPIIQNILRGAGLHDRWPTVVTFLDDFWMEPARIAPFAHSLWRAHKIPGEPPWPLLLSIEAWRLYLEGLGVLVYRAAFAREQGRQVQVSDLSQLVYLAVRRKRILVTIDQPFLEAASEVVHGRYQNARVLHWEEFIGLA